VAEPDQLVATLARIAAAIAARDAAMRRRTISVVDGGKRKGGAA
jgi:hypothetical protein